MVSIKIVVWLNKENVGNNNQLTQQRTAESFSFLCANSISIPNKLYKDNINSNRKFSNNTQSTIKTSLPQKKLSRHRIFTGKTLQ